MQRLHDIIIRRRIGDRYRSEPPIRLPATTPLTTVAAVIDADRRGRRPAKTETYEIDNLLAEHGPLTLTADGTTAIGQLRHGVSAWLEQLFDGFVVTAHGPRFAGMCMCRVDHCVAWIRDHTVEPYEHATLVAHGVPIRIQRRYDGQGFEWGEPKTCVEYHGNAVVPGALGGELAIGTGPNDAPDAQCALTRIVIDALRDGWNLARMRESGRERHDRREASKRRAERETDRLIAQAQAEESGGAVAESTVH